MHGARRQGNAPMLAFPLLRPAQAGTFWDTLCFQVFQLAPITKFAP